MHPELRVPSAAHRLQGTMVSISDASQYPKIIAPIVKTAVLIQISTAAFFSEVIGVGFMNK
jgi:hypothetical protein